MVETGSVPVTEAVEVFEMLTPLGGGVDVAACSAGELRTLTVGARAGQQAIETLLMRVGVAADRLAADGADTSGSGAHGTLLGDGRRVRGSTARREAARSKTAASMSKVGDAIDRGEIGGAQVDAITNAAKDLTPDQQQKLNTDDMIDAARRDPADVFAAKVRREAERIKGDHGLADTKHKQAASKWRHWFDEPTALIQHRCGRRAPGIAFHRKPSPDWRATPRSNESCSTNRACPSTSAGAIARQPTANGRPSEQPTEPVPGATAIARWPGARSITSMSGRKAAAPISVT